MGMVALAALLLGAQDARELIKAGQAYLQAEDPESALKAYDAALRIAPDEATAWLGRAYARLGLKQPVEDCAKDVERALELAPESPDVRMARGALRQMRGLHAEAVADFTWILEKDPGNAGARRRRGQSCYELDRYPEAAADFTAAIEAGVKDPGVFHLRGRCRNSLLDMRGAVADATRVLNERPGNAGARLLRATSHYALGSWENASRDLDLFFAT